MSTVPVPPPENAVVVLPPSLRPVENYRVVENFCPRIEDVRRSALESGFDTWRPPQGISGHKEYDGMNFVGLHSLMLLSLHVATGQPAYANRAFFRVTSDITDTPFVHSDRHDGAKTCICYMSHEGEGSGTAFFRHRATGLTRMPPVAQMQADGTWDKMWADMQNPSSDVWEEWDFVRAGYNKALIFDAPLFHARRQPHDIDPDPTKARMVWVAHYHLAQTVESQP